MKNQVKEMSLERAKNLLGHKNYTDVQVKYLVEKTKAFCKVCYQLYLQQVGPDAPKEQPNTLGIKPPDEFTRAA